MRQRQLAPINRGAVLVVMALILTGCLADAAVEEIANILTCQQLGGTPDEGIGGEFICRFGTVPLEDPDVNNCNFQTCS
jgi:hypothetical protein